MKELLKNQQKIRFSGSGASHQNGAEDHTVKIVVNIERTMLMHAALISPKDTLSTDCFQWKWTTLNEYIFRFLVCSMVYKLLVNYQ